MRRSAALMLVGALAVATACSGDEQSRPKPTPDSTAPTTVVDRSGFVLAGVGGQTTTTIVERGTATLTGSVRGPGGPVVGATVRIERLVAGREVRTDLTTGPDGRFLLGDAPGGRYRVRAFLAPSLVQLVPEVRFLADGKEHAFDLVVEQQSGLVVRAVVAPDPPLQGKAVNLVASVANRSVDADGILRYVPVVGATVELVGLGRWELRDDTAAQPGDSTTTTSTTSTSVPVTSSSTTTTTTSPPRAISPFARTDGGGRVRYELRCVAAGSPGLSLKVPVTVTSPTGPTRTTTQTIALELPSCVDPSTLTTTTTEAPDPSTTGKP